MRRRDFIALIGCTAALPAAARAQPGAMPTIGYLAPAAETNRLAAFHQGLKESGYVEGQNLVVEKRFGQYEQIPAMAADLVRRKVDVILAGGTFSARSAKAATSTIPIVFVVGSDPVKLNLAASINRPGGNVTGILQVTHDILPKHLELLRDLMPKANVIGVLLNPSNPDAEAQTKEASAAAAKTGLSIHVVQASRESEIETAFAELGRRHAEAVVVASDGFFNAQPRPLTALAARHRIPAIFATRLFAEAGGLISYGASIAEGYRDAALYAGRILKGEKPADLPILQPTRFELIVNLKTAKALGLTIPETFLLRADQVIE